MLKQKTFLFPFAGSLLVVAALAGLGIVRQTIYGQVTPDRSASGRLRIVPGATPTVIAKTGSALPVISSSAATSNVRFRDSLEWTFGSKAQHGWYLYVPLIQQTLGVVAGSDTPDFARSVSLWQARNGIGPTGVIDSDTLYQMVKQWQAQRLNSSQYPAPDQLMSAPITDFYDPTRDVELLRVERETYAAYKRMVAAAAKDLKLKTTSTGELAPEETFLKIVSAFRSREYQEKLRKQSPGSGSAGLAVNSPHFTGKALDLYVGGEPTSTRDDNRLVQIQTPVYKWLVKNAARFGFYPYYYEPWHWEHVGESGIK
jgi:zinc D-Ala-D-Ala carboxypeptidase